MLKQPFQNGMAALLLCSAGWAASGDILSVTIDSTGWRAEIVIEGVGTGGVYDFGLDAANGNDPADAKCVFRVWRPGYNAAALPDTVLDLVYATFALRKPYPDQAIKDEDANNGNVRVRVVLSEYIHVRDSVRCDLAAGVYTAGTQSNAGIDLPCVNASKQGYASPVGNWTYPDRQLITNDTVAAQCFVVHRSGRNGKPVACVIFTATDEVSNTVRDTVLVPSVNTGMGDAVPVCEYWTRMDVSSLRDGDKLTLNFKAYPWVGDVVLSTDDTTVTALNQNFRDQVFYLDRSASFGRAYAFVDTGGNNSTGVASADSATAFASPFADLGTALDACETYCGVHFSRNNADNCVIYLTAGNHECAGNYIALSNTNSRVWTEVRGYPSSDRDRIELIPGTGDIWSRVIGSLYTRLSHVTLRQNVDSWVAVASSAQHILWFDKIKLAGYSQAVAWTWAFYNFGTLYFTHSLIDSSKNAEANIIRGNTISSGRSLSAISTIVGNLMYQRPNDGYYYALNGYDENGVVAYNEFYRIRNLWLSGRAGDTMNFGMAMVGNVVERVESGEAPVMGIGPGRNVIVWNNTFTGNRYLAGYNQTSTEEKYILYSHKNSTYWYFANKGDIFSSNGAFTGGWPIRFGVGCSGNMIQHQAFDQEFPGIHCKIKTDTGNLFGYKNDQSSAATNLGMGDYSMDGTGAGLGLTADLTMPLDVTGNPFMVPGASGAYEFVTTEIKRPGAEDRKQMTEDETDKQCFGMTYSNPVKAAFLCRYLDENGDLIIYDLAGHPVDLNTLLWPGIYLAGINGSRVFQKIVVVR